MTHILDGVDVPLGIQLTCGCNKDWRAETSVDFHLRLVDLVNAVYGQMLIKVSQMTATHLFRNLSNAAALSFVRAEERLPI